MTRRHGTSLAALLGAALLGAATPAPAMTLEAARAALARGLAFDLGHAGDLGRAGVPDPVRARLAYEVAARAGLPDAEFNLAVMLDSGIGTPVDRRAASLWYARAASHGFARAAYDLGELAEAGDGMPRNPALAADWFEVAANAGVAAARLHVEAARPPGPTTLAAPTPEPVQVDAAAPGAPTPVELVWTATAMPNDARFFIEVASLGTDGARDLIWREVSCSAALVDLPQGRYAWRVFTASAATAHYQSSPWTAFSINPDP